MKKPNGLDFPTGKPTKHWENWVSQGFLAVECDSRISPENWGFDVRWVRFPKYIPPFSTLYQLALSWLETFSIVAAQDGFVCLVVVGEAVVGGVPSEFLTGETGGFDG